MIDIENAVINRYKALIAYVLVFALLGAGFGLVLYNKGDISGTSSADEIELADISKIEYDKDYYVNAVIQLNVQYDILDNYLSVLNAEMTVTDNQLATIDKLKGELQNIRADMNNLNRVFLNQSNPIVPDNFLNEELVNTQTKLGGYQARAQEANNLFEDLTTVENVSDREVKELTALAEEKQYYSSLSTIYSDRLSWLETYDEHNINEDDLFKQVERVENLLNQVTGEVNSFAVDMAVENLIHIKIAEIRVDESDYYGYKTILSDSAEKNSEYNIGVEHGVVLCSAENSFITCFVFCILVGLCVGMYMISAKEVKNKDGRSK